MIILKVTKNQGFTHSLEDTFFEPPPHPSRFMVKHREIVAIKIVNIFHFHCLCQPDTAPKKK